MVPRRLADADRKTKKLIGGDMNSNRKNKHQNFVAKYMEEFNRPATHKDKKKEAKKNGYQANKVWVNESVQ